LQKDKGLGLIIIKKITEFYNEKLEIESALNKYAVVNLALSIVK